MRKAKNPATVRLLDELNRIRKREGLESVGMLTLAGKMSNYHPDRNPRVAEALKNTGLILERSSELV